LSYILNIETATEICSVAIGLEGNCVYSAAAEKPYSHTTILTKMIIEATEASGVQLSDLHAIALSAGPGSYTGLRVGCSTVKGLCMGLEIPLIAVSSLAALANLQLKGENQLIYPMIDARRMEVYTNGFDHNLDTLGPDFNQILDEAFFSGLQKEGKSLVLCGNGASKAAPLIGNSGIEIISSSCDAAGMCSISHARYGNNQFEDLAYFEPFYLKPANVTQPKPLI